MIKHTLTILGTIIAVALIPIACIAAIFVPFLLIWPNDCSGLFVHQETQFFSDNREEFVRIANEAGTKFVEGNQYYVLTGSSLYDNAYILDNSTRSADGYHIEFIRSQFYCPIVYISTDDPDHVYDTCSAGGSPRKKLEENWYICERDWN